MRSVKSIFQIVKIIGIQFLPEDVKSVKCNRLGKNAEVTFYTDDPMADDLSKNSEEYFGVIVWLDSKEFQKFIETNKDETD